MKVTDKYNFAIVPYATEKKKTLFLNSFFVSRRRMYFFFAAIFVFFYFFGYSYGQKYCNLNISAYVDYFPKWLCVMTFAAYFSSFTIFSPVLAVFMLSCISVYYAFLFSFASYFLFPVVAVCSVVSIVYFTEIFICYDRAKYGIKQIFKPKSVIAISLLTLFFLIFTLLVFKAF